MKILYFDCFSGISGDMTLGALTDLGVPFDYLKSELTKLAAHGWDLTAARKNKNGINANYIKVIINEEHNHEHDHAHNHEHAHNSYAEIKNLINSSGLNDNVKKAALDIFGVIAEAEAKIHGAAVSDVTFHEVGALDSIIDIVGTAVCVDYLKPDKIISSAVNDGFGFTKCRHGLIPVPVPAVAEIFANNNIPGKRVDINSELVTPTGAGIIATLASGFGLTGEYKIIKTGYGAGTKDLEIPNVLRVQLLETEEPGKRETVTVVETNIDDTPPEILAYTMERLLKAGALDVFFTPIYMKKNRPAVKLTVLCSESSLNAVTDIIFTETSTIGLRIREESRVCLRREKAEIMTKYGKLAVKDAHYNGAVKRSPEYEDAKRLAEEAGIPLREVYDCVRNDEADK